NGELFSPYDFWQYFRNTEDADVEKWLKIFTRLPLSEIAKLTALGGTEINEAKKVLATEVTAIVHGRAAATEAAHTAQATFESGAIDLSLPTATISHAELANGVGILAALVTAGLAASNGEARRHIQSGAVRVNDAVIEDDKLAIGDNALLSEGVIKLSVGKKRHALLKPV
ncbi:MAG: tyrosine--tRNA ligase, partial [Alphaproteobacteria bacterium]|nr:tyrosine--tRNA ligase [Alphaproteobacteria bacterium]